MNYFIEIYILGFMAPLILKNPNAFSLHDFVFHSDLKQTRPKDVGETRRL